NLTIAVPIGLLLAMVSFIRRISGLIEVKEIQAHRQTEAQCPEIVTFTVRGPLFFGAAAQFERTLSRSIRQRPSILILKMRYVSMIDATAASNLASFVEDFIRKK